MLTEHSKATIAINSVFPFLAVLAVALRLYARRLKNLAFKPDDYAIIGALISTIGNSIPLIYCAVRGGMGEHIAMLNNDELVVFGKVTFWTQFAYIFAVSLIKLSILLLYRSVFVTPRIRFMTSVLGGVLFLWTVAFFFATLFQAWPISVNWNMEEAGSEVNEFRLYTALACTELALDAVTLTLPWTVIWKLHLKTSRKWMVSGVFTLGWFACVSSAFRIYYLTTTHTSASQDFTYDAYNIFIWTAIEPCVGVICACLPALGPIFQGGQSPGNLVGRIRSYVKIRTQGKSGSSSIWTSRSRNQPEQSHGSYAKSFHRMPEDAVILTSVYERRLDDTEDKAIPLEVIFVHAKVYSVDDGTDRSLSP